MKNLEQEAKNYAVEVCSGIFPKTFTQLESIDHAYLDFLAGANSKWVRAEKIMTQIEVLELHIEHPTKPGYRRHDILDRIKSLKIQLKQLEDE